LIRRLVGEIHISSIYLAKFVFLSLDSWELTWGCRLGFLLKHILRVEYSVTELFLESVLVQEILYPS